MKEGDFPLTWSALLDIGSTFTKGVAVNLTSGQPIAFVQVPSSIEVDVGMGVNQTVEKLTNKVGSDPLEAYASSSARGGLGVIAIGLVPRFTLEAARQAALGSGAKVLHAFGYSLTPEDLTAIERARPDIILLCGGTDGGDEECVIGNATKLVSALTPGPTVVIAGNRNSAPRAAELLEHAAWETVILPNVLPELDRLEVESIQATLRSIFLKKITQANGIEAATRMLNGVVMPTPAAVLAAGELLGGLRGVPALLEDLVIIDVGGATTDVVSVAQIYEPEEDTYRVGLPESVVKRTVEGDLGLRHNATTIVERYGIESALKGSGNSEDVIMELLELYRSEPALLPSTESEIAFDGYLARTTIREAMIRHAGHIEEVRIPHSPSAFRLTGKDLRPVHFVIGTGGALNHRTDALSLLEQSRAETARPESLRPRSPQFLLDKNYSLYACGLLAERLPHVARLLGAATLGLVV